MKQHSIPQNILDIEFKLFTKFTIREFIYMAVGIGFGGIFLLLYSNRTIPAMIALPIFLISTGVGLFLGLVPINDQNADIFLGNYFKAITKPTQRVWRSEQFDEKVQVIADSKGISLTTGTMKRSDPAETGSKKIIGGSETVSNSNQFIEESTLDQIDQEELDRLKEIENIASEAGSLPIQTTADTTELKPQVVTAQESTGTIQIPEISQASTQEAIRSEQPIVIEQKSENTVNIPDIRLKHNESTEPRLAETTTVEKEVSLLPPTIESAMQTTTLQKETPSSSVSSTSLITISKDTIDSYKTQVEGYQPQVGTISLYITDKEGTPIPQVLAMIKDTSNAVVQVYISDPQGLITPNHQLKLGTYSIELKEDNHEFPSVNYILGDKALPVVNIKSIA